MDGAWKTKLGKSNEFTPVALLRHLSGGRGSRNGEDK